MSHVRWGVLGTATIAREAVVPAIQRNPYDKYAKVVAIASRRMDRAQEFASTFDIERAYGSYEELFRDPEIDAVYIPLPNHLHVPFAIKALEMGKHVLCEKPIALNASQAKELLTVARQHPRLIVSEAFMYRYHPQWTWVKETLRNEVIGEIRSIDSSFSFFDDDPKSILHRAEWGGGALMDIGCYSVSLSRWLFDREPERVMAVQNMDPRFDVDGLTSGIMDFSSGVATFTCTTEAPFHQQVSVQGKLGRIVLELPFNPPCNQPSRALLSVGEETREVVFDICDQYGIQADRFSRMILGEDVCITPLDDAVANMQTIDALVASAKIGTWIVPGSGPSNETSR